MADVTLLNRINGTGEVDTSMLLDTLMYSDALGNTNYNGHTVEYIVKDLMKRNLSEEAKSAVENLNTYLETHSDSGVGALILHSSSDQLGGDYKGAKGAAFYSTDETGAVKDMYVAFRGTGEGRWYDNGDAFDKKYSEYQQDAAQYFDYVMGHEDLKITSESNVITTGHSKGGNFAQFVALGSQNAYLVDKCVSFDGQGFSPEAIEYFKELYGEDFYRQQCEKMYSVSGDNDYVNVLGVKVIPERNTVYIETPTDVYDFPNGHALYRSDSDHKGNLFDYSAGEFYRTTENQRELSVFAKSLSDEIMKLPPEQREDVCRSLMSYLERFLGDELTVGLGGETASFEEQLAFFAYIDVVVDELIYTKEGQDFINKSVNELIRNLIPIDDDTFIGNIAVTVLSGFIQGGFGGAIFILEGFVDGLSHVVSTGAKAFKMAYEFCGNLKDSLVKFYKENFDNDYKAAQEYLGNETFIQLHTQDLHDLAQKLWAINGRLQTLDSRLDSLYSKVRWRDLWSLMNADFKVCWSSRINKCANCLNDTANRFESVEQQLLQMLG